MERDLFEERVFLNPPWEWAQQIGHHFENCRRAAPTATMGAFVLSKWAKFNELSRHWKFYQEFPARTQVFTRESLDDPTKQEVICSNPLACSTLVSRCIVCFNDQAPTTTHDEPTSVRVPSDITKESIATLPQFSSKHAALLTDMMEAWPLICTKLTVKTHDGRQLISGLVNCAATLDFVLEDFVRRFALKTRKSPTKTRVRLANGHRVTSSIVCDITFELARHEFQRNFYVLRDLRAADLVLGLPWLDDVHAFLPFGTTRVFTLMDGGTTVETQIEEERRHECLLMSSAKIQKLMRKTRRRKGRTAEFYVIEITPATEQPAEFHTREELTTKQCDNFRSLLYVFYDDFMELLQPIINSPLVSRHWITPLKLLAR
jgi:hypothetical protein